MPKEVKLFDSPSNGLLWSGAIEKVKSIIVYVRATTTSLNVTNLGVSFKFDTVVSIPYQSIGLQVFQPASSDALGADYINDPSGHVFNNYSPSGQKASVQNLGGAYMWYAFQLDLVNLTASAFHSPTAGSGGCYDSPGAFEDGCYMLAYPLPDASRGTGMYSAGGEAMSGVGAGARLLEIQLGGSYSCTVGNVWVVIYTQAQTGTIDIPGASDDGDGLQGGTGGGNPDDPGTKGIGGTLGYPTVYNVKSESFINNMGSATIDFNDIDLVNIAAHVANAGKFIEIWNGIDIKVFQGELLGMQNLDDNHLQYIMTAAQAKFNDVKVGLDPRIINQIVRNIDYNDSTDVNILNDNNASFASYPTRIAVFTMSNQKKRVYNAAFTPTGATDIVLKPFTDSPSYNITPDDEEGGLQYTYFQDEDLNPNINSWGVEHFTGITADHIGIELYYNIFVTNITNISKIVLDLIVSFRNISNYGAVDDGFYPIIGIYNYTDAAYVDGIGEIYELYQLPKQDIFAEKDSDDNFGRSECPNKHISIDITKVITDEGWTLSQFFNEIESHGDKTQYQIRICIGSGFDLSFNHTIHLYKNQLTLDLIDIEPPTQSQFAINTGNSTSITFDTNASLTLLPSQDGFSNNDIYSICKTYEDFVTDAFDAKSWNWTLNMQVTDAALQGLNIDYTNKVWYELLQDVTDRFNGIWYIDEQENELRIYTFDNIVIANRTLTFRDLKDKRVFFKFDWSNIKDNVTVIGKNNNATLALSPTITHDLGDEDAIITAPEILDYQSLVQKATEEGKRMVSPLQIFTVEIDIDYGTWDEFKKGQQVVVKFPDENDAYILDDTLLIYGWGYEKTGTNPEKNILYLMKRYV